MIAATVVVLDARQSLQLKILLESISGGDWGKPWGRVRVNILGAHVGDAISFAGPEEHHNAAKIRREEASEKSALGNVCLT